MFGTIIYISEYSIWQIYHGGKLQDTHAHAYYYENLKFRGNLDGDLWIFILSCRLELDRVSLVAAAAEAVEAALAGLVAAEAAQRREHATPKLVTHKNVRDCSQRETESA